MSLLALTSILDLGTKLIDRVIPDPQKKLEAQIQLAQLAQTEEFKKVDAELAALKQQSDINLEEAKSSSLFVSGWRPSIGWVCSAALAYQYLVRPLGTAAYVAYTGHAPAVALPGLDDNLWQLLTGMLGLGALRSFDKAKGTTK